MIENEIPADGLSLTRSQSTPRELESIYRTRFDRFHSVATAITGDPERGRDAVQEAFANALAHRTEPRHHEALEAWLWQTVINAARDERRRANRRRSREDHGGDAEAIPAAPPADRGDRSAASSPGCLSGNGSHFSYGTTRISTTRLSRRHSQSVSVPSVPRSTTPTRRFEPCWRNRERQ